jgi:hypothetical protein
VIRRQSARTAAPANDGVASWYTPGPVDGFGDRLLMFDNSGTDSLELLRFYPSLAAVAGFEEALRERVQQVGQIPDQTFPLIVAVERLEGDGALALVSTHVPGKRLSAVFDRPGRPGLNPSFVTGMVTQVVRSLTVLQSKGRDVTHSAITPERVVVTASGHVCVVEHVLGSALRRLNLSASQLWAEFGLVTAPDPSGSVCLDARTDVFQLGVMALELLLGRRLTRLELKDRLPDLLDQWSTAVARTGLAGDRLRLWLARALQMGHHGYETAADAYADLRDMPSESAAAASELITGEVHALAGPRLQPPKQATGRELSQANAFPAARVRKVAPGTDSAPPAPIRLSEPEHESADTAAPVLSRATARRRAPEVHRRPSRLAAALGLLAFFEAGVIAALVMRQPVIASPARAAESRGAIAASERLSARAAPPSAVTAPTAPVTNGPPAPTTTAQEPIAAANNQRSGGVLLQAPIGLHVMHGDEVLGSTADGPIIMRTGTYQLDLINTALGLRLRREVTFREGQLTRMDIPLPMGLLNVNARPWAEVSIDNRSYGETPLANLSVPIGNHEIVFSHPVLGERRQMITVRADGPTRVAATLER